MKIFTNHIERETFYRMSFLIVIFVFFILFVIFLPIFLTPILLSIIFAYILMPIVNFLEKHSIPRGISVLIIYILVAYVLFISLQSSYLRLFDQFSGLETDIPKIVDEQLQNIQNFENKYSETYSIIKNFDSVNKIKLFFKHSYDAVLVNTPRWISSIFYLFVFIPFFTFFFVKDARKIRNWILGVLPNKFFESGLQIMYDINKSMTHYIQGRIWEAFIVAIITYIGLLILGVKYAILLAVIAGFLNLIPYVGPLVAVVPGLLIAYYYSNSLWYVFLTGCVYGVAQLLDTILIIPVLFSRIINIHPVIVVMLIVVGGYFLGVLGMVFAVPVYSIIKAVTDTILARISS